MDEGIVRSEEKINSSFISGSALAVSNNGASSDALLANHNANNELALFTHPDKNYSGYVHSAETIVNNFVISFVDKVNSTDEQPSTTNVVRALNYLSNHFVSTVFNSVRSTGSFMVCRLSVYPVTIFIIHNENNSFVCHCNVDNFICRVISVLLPVVKIVFTLVNDRSIQGTDCEDHFRNWDLPSV